MLDKWFPLNYVRVRVSVCVYVRVVYVYVYVCAYVLVFVDACDQVCVCASERCLSLFM